MSTLYSQSSMFMSLTQWNVNRSHSLRTASVFKWFFQQFPWVLQLWRFFIKWYQKEWSKKWLTWNFVFSSFKKMWNATFCDVFHLHCVTSYIKQNKSCKQTLEGAQNGLHMKIGGSLIVFILKVFTDDEILMSSMSRWRWRLV